MKSHLSRPLALAAVLVLVLVVLLAVAASAAQAQSGGGGGATASGSGGEHVVGWGHPSTRLKVRTGIVLTGPRGGAAIVGVGAVSASSGFTVGEAIASGALAAFLIVGILYGAFRPRRARPALAEVPEPSAESEQKRKAA